MKIHPFAAMCLVAFAVVSRGEAPETAPGMVSPDVVRGWDRHVATLLFFTAVDCPIANGYAPEMEKIFEAYREKGVAVYRVYSMPGADAAAAEKHGKEYGLQFPAVLDAAQALAHAAGARVTPTAVVFDRSGKRRYAGRIDNRYVDFGKYRPAATVHDLRDALDAVLAGKDVATAETKAIGCFLPEPPAAQPGELATP